MKAVKVTHEKELTREDASLTCVVDGAGVGKTRILELLRLCAEDPAWHNLCKLEIKGETLQVMSWANVCSCIYSHMYQCPGVANCNPANTYILAAGTHGGA